MEKYKRSGFISPAKDREAAEVEWLPLQKHPVFSGSGGSSSSTSTSPDSRIQSNLIAWDGSARLYLWDPNSFCVHRLSLRFPDCDPPSVEADSSSKMLHLDIHIHFTVYNISINRTGSSLLLSSPKGLHVVCLYERTATKDNTTICRTISVGSQIYINNSNFIRVLQASWHPYSDSHLGILSSDSVFRLFDLSSDLERPEQEYYLQPVEAGRCHNAVSICPVSFSFGGEHLWDRFSVFILFSDGSVYVLCPVIPFGSFHSWTSIEEIYKDAHAFGQKSSNSKAVNNSSMAIAWLEATFPDFVYQEMEGGNLLALKAHPHVPFDASLALQGPLRKVCRHEESEDTDVYSAECEGRAVSFLYNSISKDSVLLTAWSSGQLQIDALADELQPVWKVGSSPRICADSSGHIIGVAMICESIMQEALNQEIYIDNSVDTVWLGHPPPLLRLAVVDLALPANAVNSGLLSIFADPLVPERIYCLHSSGIDLIVLHFLPFSIQTTGKDETVKAPSVYPILSTCHSNACSSSPLHGFIALADPFGNSWIVGVTTSWECIVMEMKGWNMTMPFQVSVNVKSIGFADLSETRISDIISKDLLVGPKVAIIPQASSGLRSLAAESIEGRSTLHHFFKLFHENYVEYAHKVYIELKHHGAYLKGVLSNQHERLHEAYRKLHHVEEKQRSFDDRIHRAVQAYRCLEERLRNLRSFKDLPGANKKPLTRAEREFKSQLDRFTGMELDALHSSIEVLNARLRRHTQTSQGNGLNSPREMPGRRKNHVSDVQINQLKSAISKLSLVNSENTKKLKLVESTLRSREGDK